jgi:hypothetical protein
VLCTGPPRRGARASSRSGLVDPGVPHAAIVKVNSAIVEHGNDNESNEHPHNSTIFNVSSSLVHASMPSRGHRLIRVEFFRIRANAQASTGSLRQAEAQNLHQPGNQIRLCRQAFGFPSIYVYGTIAAFPLPRCGEMKAR